MTNIFNLTLFTLTIVALCCNVALSADTPYFNCNVNATGFEFDRERISGDWYEVARVPESVVPACVKVNAPAALDANNSYNLQLHFVNNVNSKWQQESEVLKFPWDNNATENGIFELKYGSGASELKVTFKLVITDYDSYAIVCGTTSISSASLVKFMSRERQPSDTIKNQVNQFVTQYDLPLTWVQQNQKCNDAMKILPTLTLLLAVIYVLLSIIF